MGKTIGRTIAEIESHIDSCRRTIAEIERFKFIFDNAPDEKKRQLLVDFLGKYYQKEEIGKILTEEK